MNIETIILSVIGGLWTLIMYLAKLEIGKMNQAIEKLSDSITILSRDFYKLQGEHNERCKLNLA
jgi:hypothetical protein